MATLAVRGHRRLSDRVAACIFLTPTSVRFGQKAQHRDVHSRDLGLSGRGIGCALSGVMSKRIVYVIRSRKDPSRHYVGLTSDLPARLASHNAGESPQTRALIPWALVVSVQFASEDAASRFERFLKSGAGRLFGKRYFE